MKTVGSDVRATVIGVGAILLWAALSPLTVGARGIPPFELLALTFGISCIAGLLALAAQGRAALAQLRQPWAPWGTAFAGIFLYHALYFFAMTAAPVAEASLINYLWPLLIVLFSSLLPGERLQRRHVLGAMLGFAGTALIVLGGSGTVHTGASLAGYAAAFACALVWAGYSVLNRRFQGTPSGMIVGVCGAVALAGLGCHLLFETTVAPLPRQWIPVAALGIGPVGLAFPAWDHATKHGRLSLLGTLSYLAPLISTLLLIAIGEASSGAVLLMAAILIIFGAMVAAGVPRRA